MWPFCNHIWSNTRTHTHTHSSNHKNRQMFYFLHVMVMSTSIWIFLPSDGEVSTPVEWAGLSDLILINRIRCRRQRIVLRLRERTHCNLLLLCSFSFGSLLVGRPCWEWPCGEDLMPPVNSRMCEVGSWTLAPVKSLRTAAPVDSLYEISSDTLDRTIKLTLSWIPDYHKLHVIINYSCFKLFGANLLHSKDN